MESEFMCNIGEYIYDPDRLIFYKSCLTEDIIEKIRSAVEINDQYDEQKTMLDNLDADNMTIKERPIDQIGICLTYNCQLRCNYCSYSSTEDNCDLLDSNDIIAFVVDVIKKRTIHSMVIKKDIDTPLRFFFTGGGEPTYNWKLFKEVVVGIIDKCKQYCVPYYLELTTNGLLNNLQRKFITDNFNKVMLSYDGMPDTQNKNRRTAKHINTSKIVEDSISFFGDSGLSLTIRSTVWHTDFGRMREM